MLKLKGKVMNSSEEERELVDKSGMRARHKIGHILLIVSVGGVQYVANVRAFDISFELPKVGADWETPPVKTYTCYDGQVAEVTV